MSTPPNLGRAEKHQDFAVTADKIISMTSTPNNPADRNPQTDRIENAPGEKRFGAERRRRSVPSLSILFSGGRRCRVRRVHDQRRIVILDRYSPGLLAVIMGILFLSLTDAFLTLNLIEHGASEINPVMAYFLQKGPLVFTLVKYGLTSLAVIIFLLVKNSVIQGSRMRTRSLFTFAFVCFLIAVVWQIILIFTLSCRSLLPC